MWETEWASRSDSSDAVGGIHQSMVQRVDRVAALVWAEHCIECGWPHCYLTCSLYVERADKRCARFRNGIQPNPAYRGLFSYGAEVHFRRWGKLECDLTNIGCAMPLVIRALSQTDRCFIRFVNTVGRTLRYLNPGRRVNSAYARLRRAGLAILSRRRAAPPGYFLVEVWNEQACQVGLIIELVDKDKAVKYRQSLALVPGHNLAWIPAAEMFGGSMPTDGLLRVYPDCDAEAHLVFTWLDLVWSLAKPVQQTDSGAHSTKIKCVVWDLDNTMWLGVLADLGPGNVVVHKQVMDTIRQLDQRGILQSVSSKNDAELASNELARLGILDYFVHPEINWGPKSSSITRIAAGLNIGVDTFAFIDDSAAERAEVSTALPRVRVFADTDVSGLLSRPEFDVPITPEASQRRQFYQSEAARREIVRRDGTDTITFLRDCHIEARIFTPGSETERLRCLELIQRTNQLNLSSRRYTPDEFENLLREPGCIPIAMSCRDRYGDYGIVGFAAIEPNRGTTRIREYVLSCRVAQKKVENAWFAWLLGVSQRCGSTTIEAMLVRTERNGLFCRVVEEVGFRPVPSRTEILSLSTEKQIPFADVVAVQDDTNLTQSVNRVETVVADGISLKSNSGRIRASRNGE